MLTLCLWRRRAWRRRRTASPELLTFTWTDVTGSGWSAGTDSAGSCWSAGVNWVGGTSPRAAKGGFFYGSGPVQGDFRYEASPPPPVPDPEKDEGAKG